MCPDINVQLNRIRSLQYTAELYIKSFIDENSQRLSEICDFSPLADGDALVKPFSDRLSELENKLNMVADADTKKKLTVALSDGELMCDISEVIKYEQ